MKLGSPHSHLSPAKKYKPRSMQYILGEVVDKTQVIEATLIKARTETRAGLYLIISGKVQEGVNKIDRVCADLATITGTTTMIRKNMATAKPSVQNLDHQCDAAKEQLVLLTDLGTENWPKEDENDTKEKKKKCRKRKKGRRILNKMMMTSKCYNM